MEMNIKKTLFETFAYSLFHISIAPILVVFCLNYTSQLSWSNTNSYTLGESYHSKLPVNA